MLQIVSMKNQNTPLLISVPKAAHLLGVDPRRLRRALELKQIKAKPKLIGEQLMLSRRVIEKLAAE